MLYLRRRNNSIHQDMVEFDQLESSLVEMNLQGLVQKNEHEPEIQWVAKTKNILGCISRKNASSLKEAIPLLYSLPEGEDKECCAQF